MNDPAYLTMQPGPSPYISGMGNVGTSGGGIGTLAGMGMDAGLMAANPWLFFGSKVLQGVFGAAAAKRQAEAEAKYRDQMMRLQKWGTQLSALQGALSARSQTNRFNQTFQLQQQQANFSMGQGQMAAINSLAQAARSRY